MDACRLLRRKGVLAYIYPRACTHLHVQGVGRLLVFVLYVAFGATIGVRVAFVTDVDAIFALFRHDGFGDCLAIFFAQRRFLDDDHVCLRIAFARLDNYRTGIFEHRHEIRHRVG